MDQIRRTDMNSLHVTFIIQIILWIILFFLICYLVRRNSELKKNIENLRRILEKDKGKM